MENATYDVYETMLNDSTVGCNFTNSSDCIWNNTNEFAACNGTNCLTNRTFDLLQNDTFPEVAAAKVYWALVMIPLPLVAVVGNILVILSVYKERSLQSATNYFIVSLAFADLLVAAVAMPFAVYVLVNVDWELSETLCDFYIALDVTCSTASIFNLVAISIDRFIAVTQPIKYAKHKNNKRVFLTIVIVWLVSAAIGSPIVLGLNTSPERIPNLCVFYNSDFIICSSLSSFYIPCIVMIYLYYKIFRAIHERAKKAIGQKTAAKTKNQAEKNLVIDNKSKKNHTEDSNSKEDTNQAASHGKRLTPLVEAEEVSQMYDDDDEESPPDKEEGQVISNITVSSFENVGPCAFRETEFNNPHTQADKTSLPLFKVNGSAVADKASFNNSVSGCAISQCNAKKNLLKIVKPQKNKKKKREKNAARRERKATKTLAIVLGVFLICWVPFFTCNVLDAICIKLQNNECRPGVTTFLLTTWLGYINSCVNPVIYTIFNMEFRKAFKKLLLGSCN